MHVGRTFTERMRIEARQHTLLGLDLGEGPKRRDLRIALIMSALWLLLVVPIIGVPNQFTISLYIIPPAVLITLGVQESTVHSQRIRLFDWTRRGHYALVGSRPVLNLGRAQPRWREQVPLTERVHWREVGRYILPWTIGPEWEEDHTEARTTGPVGRRQRITQKVRLIGNDRLHQIWTATVGRKMTKQRTKH